MYYQCNLEFDHQKQFLKEIYLQHSAENCKLLKIVLLSQPPCLPVVAQDSLQNDAHKKTAPAHTLSDIYKAAL